MIEIIVISIAICFFIWTSFIIGLYYGSKIKSNEKIEIPNINPVKSITKKIEQNKEKEENDLLEEIMKVNLENIELYDGTSIGQKNIPNK